jgi:protein-disulfide isomerase
MPQLCRLSRAAGFFLALVPVFGMACMAQSRPASNSASVSLARQVELLIRSQYNVPPDYTITLGARSKSDTLGYDSLPVIFSNGSAPTKAITFLISKDNAKLARMETFDLAKNPALAISTAGRPVLGSPDAKVTIVGFDDLECPFCARMNATLFPATQRHYGNLVRFIYLDDPIPQHPWAMHAAIDVNCVAAQYQPGYWDLVNYIHSHADTINGERQSVASSDLTLDDLTRQQGLRDKLDMNRLNACITAQDDGAIRASSKQGQALGVDSTPTLFINGERSVGAIPASLLWKIVDRAILDAGGVPPPPQTTPATRPVANAGN